MSTFGAAHVRKDTRLSPPAQLQCSCFGVWDPGNEANYVVHLIMELVISDTTYCQCEGYIGAVTLTQLTVSVRDILVMSH